MMRKILFMGTCMLAFASCTTVKPLYSWYNYEEKHGRTSSESAGTVSKDD